MEHIQFCDELRPSSDLAREAKSNLFKMRGGWNEKAANAAIEAIDALDRVAYEMGQRLNAGSGGVAPTDLDASLSVVRKIRACEGEAAARLVLEKFAMSFAAAGKHKGGDRG